MLAGRTEDEFLAGPDRVGPYLTLLGARDVRGTGHRLVGGGACGLGETPDDAVTEDFSFPGGMLQ
jgi:hypothetical protein